MCTIREVEGDLSLARSQLAAVVRALKECDDVGDLRELSRERAKLIGEISQHESVLKALKALRHGKAVSF